MRISVRRCRRPRRSAAGRRGVPYAGAGPGRLTAARRCGDVGALSTHFCSQPADVCEQSFPAMGAARHTLLRTLVSSSCTPRCARLIDDVRGERDPLADVNEATQTLVVAGLELAGSRRSEPRDDPMTNLVHGVTSPPYRVEA